MLRIKNLTKIYKPKKGLPVTAIDNISLELPEKGMVFLLGKSGSGKSTLLNLLGGLDEYTSGEILIKGKSSKKFKSVDYDSYRNTYVGFVFQEFNVLEDYSAGKNIALALELQHKKADRQTIEAILESVDLEKSYFDRKVTELSGGQKQRVAIARAIVKNPEIILADEPTGALDSTTGKQIFDTLKKLSKDKLVIVVSHDRENAENFADRIIELADGKIISDNTLHEDNMLTKDYLTSDYKIIKSKLPLKDSFKMGASNLKHKRIRLAFSIILSFFAFTIFGLFITFAAFDTSKSEFQTAKDKEEKTLLVVSMDATPDWIGDVNYFPCEGGIISSEIYEINSITEQNILRLVFDSKQYEDVIELVQNFNKLPSAPYFATKISNLVETPSEEAAALVSAASGSRLPEEGNYGEIALSDYIADTFIECGLRGSTKTITKYEDLLGESIDILDNKLKITGVYKTSINKDNYKEYKESRKYNSFEREKLDSIKNLILSMCFVAPGFEFLEDNSLIVNIYQNFYFTSSGNEKILSEYLSVSKIGNQSNLYFGEGQEEPTLSENDIIVDATLFINLAFNSDEEKKNLFDSLSEQDKTIVTYQNGKLFKTYKIVGISIGIDTPYIYFSDSAFEEIRSAVENKGGQVYVDTGIGIAPKGGGESSTVNLIWNAADYDLNSLNITWFKESKTLEYNEVIINASSFSPSSGSEQLLGFVDYIFDGTNNKATIRGIPVKVVGIFNDEIFNASIFGSEAFAYAKDMETAPNKIMIRLSDDWNKNQKVFEYLAKTEEINGPVYSKLKPYTSATQILDSVASITSYLRDVFLYASIGLSVFAGLLLMNFISVSVANKKKEIGILRAVGARSSDVFKIFISEGFIIGSINFILSFVGVVIVSVCLNYFMGISALIPGIVQALLMAALSFGIIFIATIIPSYSIAKKKPIDSIYDR